MLNKKNYNNSFHVTEDFEIALNLIYETKEEVYDAWTLGLRLIKNFGRRSRLNPFLIS